MKNKLWLPAFAIVFLTGCTKESGPVYSGTMTINNKPVATTPTYYTEGFHVPTGKKVADINNSRDIISVASVFGPADYTPIKINFITNNFKNAFFRFGGYSSSQEAVASFNNLKQFTPPLWTELGDSVAANQIWLYRTDDDRYAKIRIISTLHEKRPDMPRPYAECTFEWVFQPDGTMTFPK
ncbi:MAG TPA: hypothetical protein P5257_06340 [Bacteroidales bacterium]|nr:hypothetical protein [Bacteroidales bacterium]HRR92838.1 hypothetical protein [Bacteroidales bacterium]HRT89723.1 hypothetical protein [Bacteroidales bacterium]